MSAEGWEGRPPEVTPPVRHVASDLVGATGMRHLDLFSGIGGFALAADRVWPGIEHTFVEIDPFCQAVLRKHWPKASIHGNIHEYEDTKHFDILSGGFPCQPFSQAGQRKGTADDRYLWPAMFAVIGRTLPRWVIAENVRGLVTWSEGLVLEKCCTDLESIGYEVQPIIIPACAVGAPHRRDRVWIVAHARHAEPPGRNETAEGQQPVEGRLAQHQPPSQDRHAADAGQVDGGAWSGEGADSETPQRGSASKIPERCGSSWTEDWPQVAARLCRLDDGLPEGVARPRGWRNAALKAYGNAIVPAVAEQIMLAIKSCDRD